LHFQRNKIYNIIMATISAKYLGNLRSEATHNQSGNKIITDAPLDNNGRGEAFSPTDLLCAALGTCMMTIMGIVANKEGITLDGTIYTIIKTMQAQPRKVAKISIHFVVKSNAKLTEIQKDKLINAAENCPVALSLSSDLDQESSFDFVS